MDRAVKRRLLERALRAACVEARARRDRHRDAGARAGRGGDARSRARTPDTPMSPSAEKVAARLTRELRDRALQRGELVERDRPRVDVRSEIAFWSATSPATTTVACGGSSNRRWRFASAVQEPRHSALAVQFSMPVHRGGLASAEHVPWHSPLQAADAGRVRAFSAALAGAHDARGRRARPGAHAHALRLP